MNNHILYLIDFFIEYADNLKKNNIIKDINKKNINIDYYSKSRKGDLSSNFFLIINKNLIDKKFDLKLNLINKLNDIEFIKDAEISIKGFINLFIKKKFLLSSINSILKESTKYGNSNLGKNKKINIEFVSANPTGPIHVAHIRGAVFGDILASMFIKTGYSVVKEYYVNDAGSQIHKLGESLYKRYCEILDIDISFEDDEYPGEYLKEIANEIYKKYNDKWLNNNKKERISFFKNFAISSIIKEIEYDLKLLDIKFDKFTYETEIVDRGIIKELFLLLKNKELLYEGTLGRPKGEDSLKWEPRKQLLFKSSKIFDDKDRPFRKANGEWTYFANDSAYHYDKFKRKFDKLINIWGADHIGYIPRMKSIVKAISKEDNYLEVLICQIVRLIENNKILKMSKREGRFVTLKKVYDAVGKDPLRYYMVSTRNETSMDFDINKVLEKNKDNPVFYCQYAFARASSVLNKAKELKINIDDINNIENFEQYLTDYEWDIILKLIAFPYILHQASINREPHRLTNYLEEMSSLFHSFWNMGKNDESLRFIQQNNLSKTYAKLIWIQAFRIIFKNIFDLINIEAPEKM